MELLTQCQYQLLELMFTNMNKDKEIKNIETNQYINDLKFPFKINTSVPTHTPKKFIDMFWIRDNSGTMELYVYVGSWKKVTIT
jgi:hypothetical protein